MIHLLGIICLLTLLAAGMAVFIKRKILWKHQAMVFVLLSFFYFVSIFLIAERIL